MEEVAVSDTTTTANGQPADQDATSDVVHSALNPSGSLTLLVDYTGHERGMGDLLTLLVSNGVVITRFAEQASDLEDIFMQVTKGIVQ